MEDKLDTILISLQTIMPRLDKIDNVVRNLKDGQTVLKRKIKAVDATMAEHSVMVIATANETKVHLSREVLKLYETFSEANDNLSSQSHTLTSKVNSLSTQTEFLTSSVDTLTSNTDTLTTRVDLVASRMDGLASVVGSLGECTDTLTSTASSLVSSTEGLTTKVNFLDTQVHTLTSEVKIVSSDVKYLISTVVSLESHTNNLTTSVTSLVVSNRALTSTLQIKLGSLSTQTQSLTSSVNTLSSNTSNLTTRVDLVASRMDGLTSAFTDSPLSIQVQNLTSLAGMAKDMLQDIQQDQTLSLIVDKIPYNIKSTFPCMQLSEDYPMANSGYYWMIDQTGSAVSTYCFINSELNPASSCRDHTFRKSGYYWVKNENGTTVNTYCIITSELNPASSCQQLAGDHPHAASDYYWVTNGAMQPVKVYCDMDQHCCNSTGGWVRVANIDMTDPNQQCPPGFHLRTDVKSCDRSDTGIGCTPITFPSHSIEYRQVCGRIRAYQYWDTLAFWPYYSSRTIEDRYVYGMSLTHGRHPRQHIWTFASAYSEYYSRNNACPCTRTDQPYTGAVPPFIGEDYFCDTAVTATQRYPSYVLYPDDPLWDGQGCGPTSTCCSFNRPPWFCKQLPQPTTDDLELRVCGDRYRKTPFDQIEIFIH